MESILHLTGSGTYLVDIFPILRYVPSWVPGATFQKEAKIYRQIQDEFRQLPYEETVRNIVRQRSCLQNIPQVKDLTDRL